jgi:hypothetical protein
MPYFSVPTLDEYSIGPTGPNALPRPVGPNVKLTTAAAITSGAQLDGTAKGPWSRRLDAGIKMWTAWRPNAFHDLIAPRIPANYGADGGAIAFDWRGWEFPPGNPEGSIAMYPGSIPAPHRPMWNVLKPVVWGLQVLSPGNINPASYQAIQADPSAFVPGGTASLGIGAPILQ